MKKIIEWIKVKLNKEDIKVKDDQRRTQYAESKN